MFVMGMAAGLIRQRCDEEPSQLQTIPNCHRWHLPPFQDVFRKDNTVVEWKRRVDLCSLLIVSVPFLSLLSPNLPFLPRLGLLANVLFVLPQLIVITGFTRLPPSVNPVTRVLDMSGGRVDLRNKLPPSTMFMTAVTAMPSVPFLT